MSVLIPARNAEATIGAAIDSVLSQDYEGSVEVIVADGSDTPATSDLVRRRYPTVTLVPNPEQIITAGILAAHGAATGEIIVRCDAHTVFPPGYLRRAVSTLRRTGAVNVGGRQRPVGTTFFGRAVAMVITTPLGAGGVDPAFVCCGGTELAPPLTYRCSRRLMFPEGNSQIGTQRVTRHCLDPLENQHCKASFQ